MPWDYPTPPGADSKSVPFCLTYVDPASDGVYNNSLLAFQTAMDDSEVNRACTKDCQPDCVETTYDFHVDTTKLEIEEMCKNRETRNVILL